MDSKSIIGQPISRLEGHLKVTGAAKYAAEYNVDNLLYGYAVNSTITKGKIISLNTTEALAIEGVVDVLTHENRPKLPWFDLLYADMDAPPGQVFKPLYDDKILYNNQPIALVIAKDFETARYAATKLIIEYKEEAFETVVSKNLASARDAKVGLSTPLKPPPPKPTGDFETNFASAPFKVDNEYHHGTEHHNPMELFASTVVYEGEGKLTIYDKTQGTINSQLFVANIFGLHYKDVRVLAPYVGGAFGAGLRPQYQLYLSAMAALHLKRNVRVTLDRSQMFSMGHRPSNVQHLRFASDVNGRLTAMGHAAFSETSQYEDYSEVLSSWSHRLYPAPNTQFDYQVIPLDLATPIDMRAPGGSTAMHAIECTMDELAFKLNMDPVDLRLINYTDSDPSTGKPFTSKALRACYQQAAEQFGWSKRNPVPRSVTRGNKLVGYGMATGIWDAFQFPSRIEMILDKHGKLAVNNATTDIGTGTLTVMTQIAAQEMALQIEDVTFAYGDSKKPFSMFQGGSAITASTGSAIIIAANLLKMKILKLAKTTHSAIFKHAKFEEVIFTNGGLTYNTNHISYQDLIAANKGKSLRIKKMGMPHMLKLRKYSLGTHSASFVEVEVDKDLGTIHVVRATTAVAAGKIVNPKTAKSQVLGSMVWGISKALHEETIMDDKLGRYMNTNLGEYHIPVHADIHQLDVIFVEEKDDLINELGAKGVGEIGIVGMPAAIANAIFNATGKRINKLPIHFDELM